MSKKIRRRTLLRGAGTIAIGLPFLNEMTTGIAKGVDDIPERLVTVFFGLGLDPSWQGDFNGPLEPYQPFADKMARFSVEMGQGNAGGAHCNTSTVVFVGEQQRSTNVAGGASIDQILRSNLGSNAPTLVSGLWWRRGACDAQALRVYNADGSARQPIKRPSQVFDNVFGSYMPPAPPTDPNTPLTPEQLAMKQQLRIRRSILDTVMDEYRHYKGDASYLGAESKQKIEQHFSSIREIETQLAPIDNIIENGQEPDPMAMMACDVPGDPRDPDIADYDRFTYGTGSGAPAIALDDIERTFALHAELYAMALRCDLARFGNLMFESAGGHTNLQGNYSAMGDSTNFPDNSQHDSYFHANKRTEARLYQHFAQKNIAGFLARLDDPSFMEANGKTVLENMTLVIGTEYGWNHSKSDVFHAVLGGGGRFKTGDFTDRRMNAIDLYNAILQGHGVTANIGNRSNVSSEGDGSVLLA